MKRVLAALVGATCLVSSPAQATDPNVLFGTTPVTVISGAGSITFDLTLIDTLTDGIFLPEQTGWQTGTVWWATATPAILGFEFNLGNLYEISGFKVQADNNDQYRFEYFNGTSWLNLPALLPAVFGFGMTTRDIVLAPGSEIVASRLRFFAASPPAFGDGAFAGSEIQAFGVPIPIPISTPVPEPGTYLMMIAGLGLLGLVARRRVVRR